MENDKVLTSPSLLQSIAGKAWQSTSKDKQGRAQQVAAGQHLIATVSITTLWHRGWWRGCGGCASTVIPSHSLCQPVKCHVSGCGGWYCESGGHRGVGYMLAGWCAEQAEPGPWFCQVHSGDRSYACRVLVVPLAQKHAHVCKWDSLDSSSNRRQRPSCEDIQVAGLKL